MSLFVLALGSISSVPLQRRSKNDRAYVEGWMKSPTASGAEFIKIICFAEAGCLELMRLREGDAVSVQGRLDVERREKAGEKKISLTVVVDRVSTFRAPRHRDVPAASAEVSALAGMCAPATKPVVSNRGASSSRLPNDDIDC
jgi:single-stranded DNA-binding protein